MLFYTEIVCTDQEASTLLPLAESFATEVNGSARRRPGPSWLGKTQLTVSWELEARDSLLPSLRALQRLLCDFLKTTKAAPSST